MGCPQMNPIAWSGLTADSSAGHLVKAYARFCARRERTQLDKCFVGTEKVSGHLFRGKRIIHLMSSTFFP
jgi:hypothetical protein